MTFVVILLGWVLLAWAASLAYAVVTFAWSQRFVPRRRRRDVIRSFGAEMRWTLWTQPLLPVFGLVGRRMGSGSGSIPVVFVHGYSQNRVDFVPLARRLRASRAGALYAFNFDSFGSLEPAALRLEAFVDRVLGETGAEQVDLVTHSCGGLLALDVAAKRPGTVRRMALIAVPYDGVTWRGPAPGISSRQLRAGSEYLNALSARVSLASRQVPTLSIYSAHDNLVHPVDTSRLPWASVSYREFDGLGHMTLLADARVAEEVAGFLSG